MAQLDSDHNGWLDESVSCGGLEEGQGGERVAGLSCGKEVGAVLLNPAKTAFSL